MDFSNGYLTYQEYQELGGTADQMPFNLLEYEARKIIDTYTFKRLTGLQEIPMEVKMCEFKLINSIESYATTSAINRNVASETTDGYSVSYVSPTQISEVIQSKNDELKDIVTTYLFGLIINGEHAIYSGV